MPNATPDLGTNASAPAPAPVSPEIVALEARLKADFDKRVAGFQRIISDKDKANAALAGQLEALSSAALSPDERAEAARQKLATENAQLRAQIELHELEGEYGDVMSTYRQLLGAGSAKDQLELIKALSTKSAEVPKIDEVEVPEVDLNNPQRVPEAGVRLDDGTLLTDSLADRILGTVGRMADVTQRGARVSSQSGVSAE